MKTLIFYTMFLCALPLHAGLLDDRGELITVARLGGVGVVGLTGYHLFANLLPEHDEIKDRLWFLNEQRAIVQPNQRYFYDFEIQQLRYRLQDVKKGIKRAIVLMLIGGVVSGVGFTSHNREGSDSSGRAIGNWQLFGDKDDTYHSVLESQIKNNRYNVCDSFNAFKVLMGPERWATSTANGDLLPAIKQELFRSLGGTHNEAGGGGDCAPFSLIEALVKAGKVGNGEMTPHQLRENMRSYFNDHFKKAYDAWFQVWGEKSTDGNDALERRLALFERIVNEGDIGRFWKSLNKPALERRDEGYQETYVNAAQKMFKNGYWLTTNTLQLIAEMYQLPLLIWMVKGDSYYLIDTKWPETWKIDGKEVEKRYFTLSGDARKYGASPTENHGEEFDVPAGFYPSANKVLNIFYDGHGHYQAFSLPPESGEKHKK